MMADLVDVVWAVWCDAAPARRRSMSASVRPAPKAPICRKLRRDKPSQKRCLAPQNVSMAGPPKQRRRQELLADTELYLGRSGRAIDLPLGDKCTQSDFRSIGMRTRPRHIRRRIE